MKYMNLYYSIGLNEYVSGKNVYDTKEEAMDNQNCPVGYIHHAVMKVRRW